MECKWEYEDCVSEKCHLCVTDGYQYEASKVRKNYRKKGAKTTSSKKGFEFEKENSSKNQNLLETRSEMTPGSGAGSIKGDEQISGIISVMEELKERNPTSTKGTKSFSIQKEWLQKLKREANEANKEFYYLKFRYGSNDTDIYIVTDEEIIMSMIKTIYEDRKDKHKAENKASLAEKRRQAAEAKIVSLESEIQYLRSLLNSKENIQGDISEYNK